jgi:hypothetical protein
MSRRGSITNTPFTDERASGNFLEKASIFKALPQILYKKEQEYKTNLGLFCSFLVTGIQIANYSSVSSKSTIGPLHMRLKLVKESPSMG